MQSLLVRSSLGVKEIYKLLPHLILLSKYVTVGMHSVL